jgi:DNA-binding IclR family transcriptional regulator
MTTRMPDRAAHTHAALRRELDELVTLGFIRRLPGERYTLTAKGHQALNGASHGQ